MKGSQNNTGQVAVCNCQKQSGYNVMNCKFEILILASVDWPWEIYEEKRICTPHLGSRYMGKQQGYFSM